MSEEFGDSSLMGGITQVVTFTTLFKCMTALPLSLRGCIAISVSLSEDISMTSGSASLCSGKELKGSGSHEGQYIYWNVM